MRMVQQWLVDRSYGSWHDLACDLVGKGHGKDERQFVWDMWRLTGLDVSAEPTPNQQARLQQILWRQLATGDQSTNRAYISNKSRN